MLERFRERLIIVRETEILRDGETEKQRNRPTEKHKT